MRLGQHANAVKNKNKKHSGLVFHSIKHKHSFAFSESKIVHVQPNFDKRLTAKALFIHLYKGKNCNSYTDHDNNVKIFGPLIR